MKTKFLLFLLPLAGLFAGCFGDDDDITTPGECEPGMISVEEFATLDSLTYTELNNTGLYYYIADSGSVNRPLVTDSIGTKYIGYITNGRVFDRTTPERSPSRFRLANVIEGWQLGLPLIGEGGIIRLLVPAELAYGSQGACNGNRCSICPDSDLIFDVELLEIYD